MNALANSTNGTQQDRNFDLVRLGRSKASVDLCSNTIRAYSREGLRLYRCGKATFFSKAELEQFIRAKAA